jgi:hypothetical protein
MSRSSKELCKTFVNKVTYRLSRDFSYIISRKEIAAISHRLFTEPRLESHASLQLLN